MWHERLQLSEATPSSAEAQATRFAVRPAPTRGNLAIELRELRARLRHAHEHVTAAMNVDLPGRRSGDALQRFLAADAEVAAIVRRIKEIQTLTKNWRSQPGRNIGLA